MSASDRVPSYVLEEEAHRKWTTARSLVVTIAREMAEDSPAPLSHMEELRAALKAETYAKAELEMILRAEPTG